MHVSSVTQSEIRITLEVTFDMANDLGGDVAPTNDAIRARLIDTGFTGAEDASEAALDRTIARLRDMLPLLRDVHGLSATAAAARIKRLLDELPISPSIVEHDDISAHMHWTPSTARFDDQVMSDILMALTQEVCEHGTTRFGRCAADGCDALFFDATRNHSRRFCSDPRCASRTHTADHRARIRAEG